MRKNHWAWLVCLLVLVLLLPVSAMADHKGDGSGLGSDNAWDVSVAQDQSVLAYLQKNTTTKLYKHSYVLDGTDKTVYTVFDWSTWQSHNATLSGITASTEIVTGYDLIFTGTGEIMDFPAGTSATKWRNNQLWGDDQYYKLILDVKIGEGITRVGNSVMEGIGAKSLSFPSTLTSIGKLTFHGCLGTSKAGFHYSIVLPAACKELSQISLSGGAAVTSVRLPEGLTAIPNALLAKNPNLKNVNIPSTVKTIGSSAFAGSAVETIALPNGLESIGEYAFSNCASLTSINFPASLTRIDAWAFYKCASLKNVDMSNLPNLMSLGTWIFNNAGVETATVNVDVSTAAHMFDTCTKLKNITLGSNVTVIPQRFLGAASSLEELILPDGVSSVGTQAFAGLSSLKYIKFGSDFVSFGANGLASATSLMVADMTASKNYVFDTSAHNTMNFGQYPTIVYLSSREQAENLKSNVSWNTGAANAKTVYAIVDGGAFVEIPKTNVYLAVLKKEGFTFGGWYTDPAFAESSRLADGATPVRHTVYYPRWTNAISFNGNGADSGAMPMQQVTDGDTTTLIATNAFGKTGYLFTGWNTAANGGETAYAADTTAYAVPNGTTLYAQWKPITYTVTLDDGAGNTETIPGIAYDTAFVLKASSFTKDGSKIVGWSTVANSDEVTHADGASLKNLADTQDADVKLYAVWAPTAAAVETKVEKPALTTVPAGLTALFDNSVEQLKAALRAEVLEVKGYTASNVNIYDVTLYFRIGENSQWQKATDNNFPTAGIPVVFEYPAGTGKDTHEFMVIHMSEGSVRFNKTPGQMENLPVTKTEKGIQVTFQNGLSPVAVAWKPVQAAAPVEVPKTGDNTPIALFGAMMLLAAAGMALMSKSRRAKAE